MASSSSSLFSVCVTTCGFIGMSLRVPRSSISSFQVFIRSCAFLRNLLFFRFSSGSSACRIVFASPTNAASTWCRRPMRVGSSSICTHFACPGLGRNSIYG